MRETLKNTTNSSVYKKLKMRHWNIGCWICFKRSGGNKYGGCDGPDRKYLRNWKQYRKTQYKIKE